MCLYMVIFPTSVAYNEQVQLAAPRTDNRRVCTHGTSQLFLTCSTKSQNTFLSKVASFADQRCPTLSGCAAFAAVVYLIMSHVALCMGLERQGQLAACCQGKG